MTASEPLNAHSTPRVSAFMSVYNGADWLEEAIDSVLRQTEADLELIIVNDGSTDATRQIIDSYSDHRVRSFHKETNEGLGSPLNDLLRACRGDYVMRLDADDVCEPDRLELQADFLDMHPNVIMVGCQFQHFVDHQSNSTPSKLPLGHDEILQGMRLGLHTMSHATTMWRRTLLEHTDGYLWDGPGEDWSLLFEAARFGDFANLPDVLYRVRIHSGSSSAGGARSVLQGFAFARTRYERFVTGKDDNYSAEQFRSEADTGLAARISLSFRSYSLLLHRRSQAARFNGDSAKSVALLASAAICDPRKALGAIWKKAHARNETRTDASVVEPVG